MFVFDHIFFLVREGQRLSDTACENLLWISQEMLRTGQRRRPLKAEGGVGFVSTEFKSASLAGLSGTEFEADVADPETGKRTRVKFITRLMPREVLEAKRGWITLHLQSISFLEEAEETTAEEHIH